VSYSFLHHSFTPVLLCHPPFDTLIVVYPETKISFVTTASVIPVVEITSEEKHSRPSRRIFTSFLPHLFQGKDLRRCRARPWTFRFVGVVQGASRIRRPPVQSSPVKKWHRQKNASTPKHVPHRSFIRTDRINRTRVRRHLSAHNPSAGVGAK
jgi:hypothetical protein